VGGSLEGFGPCLESIHRLDPPPAEVLIVADGDEEAARLAGLAGFTVLRNLRREGPARARNLGASAARGDILFFLDADVTAPPDAVGRLREVLADPGVDAVCGSYDDQPAARNFLSQYRNLLHHYVHQTARAEGSTFWGACGAIRREVFLAEGGFDAAYGVPCVEDIELGYRLRRAGRRILFSKGLQVKHWKAWSAASMLKTDFLRRALPWTELILRHRWFLDDLNLRGASRASVLVAWAMLGCLAAGIWKVLFLLPAAVLAAGLLALNAPLYAFFRRKRGFAFAAGCVFWHWIYYLYGGLAFGVGAARHVLRVRAGGAKSAAPQGARPSAGAAGPRE
jgi:GT2 family glycosyltransferase